MFNKGFYPTPLSIANKMVQGINFEMVNSMLEPSAGKGDLADVMRTEWNYAHDNLDYNKKEKHPVDIDTIEIEPDLQAILKNEGYRVVYNDFLKFHTYKHYDYIIMNPPFDEGEKHLLHALEMQENGGGVVCLLNAETIKNPYSNTRKDLLRKLNDYHADIQYLQNAFVTAERKTGVEIALVKITIPAKEKTSYFVEQLKKESHYAEPDNNDFYGTLAKNDLIKSITEQYGLEVQAGIKLINEFEAMRPLMKGSFNKDDPYSKDILKLDFPDTNEYDNRLSINEYVRRVRIKYWTALFNNPKFTSLLTQNLLNDYRNRISELADYDFSLFNIYTIRTEMSKNMVKGVEETILSLFDEFSRKYYWDKDNSSNIHYYNGWKTNKCYKINKRIILPLNAYDDIWNDFRPSYRCKSKLEDIEKVFNYLDGGLTDEINLQQALETAEKNHVSRDIHLKYFDISFYKKQTAHITFTNDDLLKKFNIYGSQHKGWLPPSYGKSDYNHMTKEEKSVVDAFEGAESYQETYEDTDYFLFDTNKLNLLSA